MLELLLKLIEQLTKLVGVREKNRQEYFKGYVQPTYEAAEAIYKDYRTLLRKLRKMLLLDQNTKPIIDFLEERREELLPIRDRLRALVVQRSKEGRVTRFEAGLLGMMTGVATDTNQTYFDTVFYDEDHGSIEQGPGGHTILDILRKLKEWDILDVSERREMIMGVVDNKIEVVERAWQNVVKGYAELQASALPGVKVPKSRRVRTHSGV